MGCTGGKISEGAGKQNGGYPLCRNTIQLPGEVYSIIALNEDKLILGVKDELQLFDMVTKTTSSISKEHTGRVNCLIKLENGNIASAGQDKTIKIWDIDKKQCLMTFSGHKSMIWCINEIKGDKLISGADDKKAKVWDIKEKKEAFDLFTGSFEISVVLQLKNGKIIISCRNDLMLFDLDSKTKEKTIEIKSGVWAIKELFDGCVMLGLGNGNLNLIDSDLNVKNTFTNGHKRAISFIIELDNHKVVSGSDRSEEKALVLWNTKDPEFKYLLKEHTDTIMGLTLVKGNKFISASKDKTLKVWE